MSSKALSNLFWFFTFLCIVFLSQTGNDSTNSSSTYDTLINFGDELQIDDKSSSDKYPQFYASYTQIAQQSSDDDRLELISQSLNFAKLEGFNNKKVLKKLHLLAANIHQSRWHVIFALDSLNEAQALMFDSRTDRQIVKLTKYLNKIDKERGLNEQYIATRDTGPAKRFKGKILVAYVFIDDGLITRWSKKTKQRTQQILKLVQQWQKEKADQYGIDNLQFINRTYVARRNPNLRNKKTISFGSDSEDIQFFVQSVAQSLGAQSIGDFIEKKMHDNHADQGVVFLHTNLNQRSFAQRCGYTHQQRVLNNGKLELKLISKCKDEYVMLMEKIERNRWDKIHYAQAHEMMHVFGAADLYNIKNAAHYSVADIMNFQSKQLVNSKVEPITAYAIGWQATPPVAPFEILEK